MNGFCKQNMFGCLRTPPPRVRTRPRPRSAYIFRKSFSDVEGIFTARHLPFLFVWCAFRSSRKLRKPSSLPTSASKTHTETLSEGNGTLSSSCSHSSCCCTVRDFYWVLSVEVSYGFYFLLLRDEKTKTKNIYLYITPRKGIT